MHFNRLLKYGFLLTFAAFIVGCSKAEWREGTTTFLQDVAHNTAKSDCDVYNRGTAQYSECYDQVDTFYKENYRNNSIIED